jgi:hypothetical protein
VLVVDELDVDDEPEVTDDVEVLVPVVAPLLPLVVVLAGEALVVPAEDVVEVAWWGRAASAENRPAPASEAAATQPVTCRLRRSQASRREGVVMPSSKTPWPQCRLSAASTPRYRLLGAP